MAQAIGIDIGGHAVKVAVLQKKGGVTKAMRLFRAPLGGDEDMVRVQGALKRAGISGGPALIGITGRDLIVRYTHVPPVPDWRLKLLMQFEINEVSGQSGGEVAADYRRLNLPVEQDEDTVLVSLARNAWLHPRLESARAAGMKAAGGCPNSVAVFNAYLAHGSWKEGESTFLVNIGRDNIDMAIQRDGELLFARNMSGGGTMFTEAIMSTFGLKEPKAEKNKVTKGDLTPKGQARYPDSTTEKLANAMQGPAGQLVSMIQSSVMICRAQTKIGDLRIDRLVLSGGTARMKGIRPYFQANMNVPVEIFDPVSELDLSGLDAGDAEELGDVPSDFAVAVGLAETLISPTAFRLEVLTEKEKKKRYFAERTLWSLLAAGVLLAFIVLLFKHRGDAIAEVQTANKELEDTFGQNKSVQDRQNKAVEEELDARQKNVALRARRMIGGFNRAVLRAVLENHKEFTSVDDESRKGIYLARVAGEPDRISLDLEGNPMGDRGARGGGTEEQKARNLHSQTVWPKLEIIGVMKRDTPNPGGTLNDYYAALKGRIGALRVDGWLVDMKTSGLDGRNSFTINFKPKAAPKAEEQ